MMPFGGFTESPIVGEVQQIGVTNAAGTRIFASRFDVDVDPRVKKGLRNRRASTTFR
jgi:hypothetical protein